jgi:hypothetical protein
MYTHASAGSVICFKIVIPETEIVIPETEIVIPETEIVIPETEILHVHHTPSKCTGISRNG